MDKFDLKKYIMESKLSLRNWEGFIDDMVNMDYDFDKGGTQKGIWDIGEFGDHDKYDEDADEFRSLSDFLRQRGGEDSILSGPLQISLVVLDNGDIDWQVEVNG